MPAKSWPFLAALVVTVCNIDFVVIPLLKKAGAEESNLFFTACALSTAELIFWYWFWGWLYKTIIRTKDVRESIEFGKGIGSELKKEGYIDQIKEFFRNKIRRALDDGKWIVRTIKAGGILAIFLAGISPEPGGRVVGTIICGTAHLKRSFCFLLLGNIVHVAYVIGGWNYIFSLFSPK